MVDREGHQEVSLAIQMDQPPELDAASAEACQACGGDGAYACSCGDAACLGGVVCDHCKGTGDEPEEHLTAADEPEAARACR